MKEVETGEHYFFKDSDYNLPWKKKEFIKKVEAYQQKGVLGLCLGNRKKIKHKLLNLKIKDVGIGEKDGIVFFFTNENEQTGIRSKWNEITKQVKLILNAN